MRSSGKVGFGKVLMTACLRVKQFRMPNAVKASDLKILRFECFTQGLGFALAELAFYPG